jgi:mannose-6-phosphate isomerase-like protein (cupin superfamily)
MIPVNLAYLTVPPESPIGEFSFNDCTSGIGCFSGRPPWEHHTGGDELLHVLAGRSDLTVIDGGHRVFQTITAGDLVIVPQGCWHSNNAPDGVTMLYITPTAGNAHSWIDPEVSHDTRH